LRALIGVRAATPRRASSDKAARTGEPSEIDVSILYFTGDPIVDAFRTLAACPPPAMRVVFESLMLVVFPWASYLTPQ